MSTPGECRDCREPLLSADADLCGDCYYRRADAYDALVEQRSELLQALKALMLANADHLDWPIGEAEKTAMQLARAAILDATGERL